LHRAHPALSLKQAGIIPQVLDPFTPLLTLSIFWENATAEVGNLLDPGDLQSAPDLQFLDAVPELFATLGKHGKGKKRKSPQLTIALTDPDAPSRENPEWSEICHWIGTDVQLTEVSDPSEVINSDSDEAFPSGSSKKLKTIMPYKPPGPPPKTGKHRYVFVALAPKNGTTEKLHLSKPGDRQHWGFGQKGTGVRDWARLNGLEVVGKFSSYLYSEVWRIWLFLAVVAVRFWALKSSGR